MDPLEHARFMAMKNALKSSGLRKSFKVVMKDGRAILKQKRKKNIKPIDNRFEILDL